MARDSAWTIQCYRSRIQTYFPGFIPAKISAHRRRFPCRIFETGYCKAEELRAGAYRQRLSNPLNSYSPLLEQDFQLLMNRKSQMAIALYRQDTVLTAWEVSCNAAQKRCPEAAEILNIFMLTRNFLYPYLKHCVQSSAYLANSCPFNSQYRALFIRRALITRLRRSPLRAWISLKAVATLSPSSLIKMIQDGPSFSAHPLIHL